MCMTCGCSSDDANVQSKIVRNGADTGNAPAHEHPHDHTHEHEHSHEHEHTHVHSHPHTHGDRQLDTIQTLRSGPDESKKIITLEQRILQKNDTLAESNRLWLASHKITALNILGGPGSGKTAILESTISMLKTRREIAVIEGDQETASDAERIKAAGCPVVQINTGAGCHLDAQMLGPAFIQLNPRDNSLLLIENVGNLVCPALFDLGESYKVVVLSVTEGEDKPLKYPHIFRAAQAVILNKIDLLPYLKFDLERCIKNTLAINPSLRVFQLSTVSGAGLSGWLAWLEEIRADLS